MGTCSSRLELLGVPPALTFAFAMFRRFMRLGIELVEGVDVAAVTLIRC